MQNSSFLLTQHSLLMLAASDVLGLQFLGFRWKTSEKLMKN